MKFLGLWVLASIPATILLLGLLYMSKREDNKINVEMGHRKFQKIEKKKPINSAIQTELETQEAHYVPYEHLPPLPSAIKKMDTTEQEV